MFFLGLRCNVNTSMYIFRYCMLSLGFVIHNFIPQICTEIWNYEKVYQNCILYFLYNLMKKSSLQIYETWNFSLAGIKSSFSLMTEQFYIIFSTLSLEAVRSFLKKFFTFSFNVFFLQSSLLKKLMNPLDNKISFRFAAKESPLHFLSFTCYWEMRFSIGSFRRGSEKDVLIHILQFLWQSIINKPPTISHLLTSLVS